MGNKFKINLILSTTLITACALLGSCERNSFDPEKVKVTYSSKFPVGDIDPEQDWKMTKQVKVNVSIQEDAESDYTIRIYDKNPLLNQSSAKLLAEGIASNLLFFNTLIDCPLALDNVFVCRIDPQSRNVVKYVSIENGQINATFGRASSATRATGTRSVNIDTYSPERSEAEIKVLLSDAEEIDSNTNYQNGKVYKISKNRTYPNRINKDGLTSANPVIIIIEGTWESNNMSVERGFEFYVLNGGKIKIPQIFNLVETSRFIVYAGGGIEGNDIRLTNASGGNYNYNAGTIDIDQFYASEKGVFYNCGTAHVDDMKFDSGCKFINQGKAYIGETHSNITVDNGCYLYAEDFVGRLNLGNNSSAEMEVLGDQSNNYNTVITMGDNSMATVIDAELAQAQFIGPENQHSLVKINKIENIGLFSSKGNIYYEVKEIDDAITGDPWWQGKFLDAIKNSDGSISKWGESPIVIPSGDCTGEGNKPDDSGSETPDTPMTYTYVFEDNFPLVGDYDFNDIVLDAIINYDRGKNNKITATNLDVTLSAAGATKTLGAGLRLIGINKSAIENISFDGDKELFQSTLANSMFSNDIESDMTIPLFGNAHKVFGVASGTMVNTGKVTAPIYTYKIKIKQNSAYQQEEPIITKDNLDFFIAYQYKSMKQRMEVHLYEFWNYGATVAGTVQKENLELAGNNTWAISVPNFRYPKESINISNQKDDTDCAYPLFLEWARNRNVNQDWYLHPNKNNVYR